MSNLSKIIAGIIAVIVIIYAISYFTKDSESGTQTLVTESGMYQSGDAKYVLTLLNKMSQVELKDSIFSDSAFVSLQDNSVNLTPQAVSRDNPFSPVSAADLARTATTTR